MKQPTKKQLDAHERMKAELRIRGASLAEIARDIDVTDAAVTLVGKRMTRQPTHKT